MHQRVMKPRFDRPERRQVRNVTRLLARPLTSKSLGGEPAHFSTSPPNLALRSRRRQRALGAAGLNSTRSRSEVGPDFARLARAASLDDRSFLLVERAHQHLVHIQQVFLHKLVWVSAINWFSDTSAKRSLLNISRKRS